MASTRALAHAPWSASKVQTALRCPRLFHYRYVEKMREPEVMPETRVGKAIHAALEAALKGVHLAEAKDSARAKLETDLEEQKFDVISEGIQPFLDRIYRFKRNRRVTRSLVEWTLAVRDDFTMTAFYSGDAYYRGIFDVAYIYDDTMALIDHKSGERRTDINIREQLQGYAVLAGLNFRSVKKFLLGVHWVADRAVDWAEPVSSAEVNQLFLPQVADNIEAAALAVADGPRPETSSWCERCSYRSVCPAGREMRFEPVEPDPEEPEIL